MSYRYLLRLLKYGLAGLFTLLLLLFLRMQSDIIPDESNSSKLNLFTESDFILGSKLFPVDDELCKTITDIEPEHIVCAHEEQNDQFISRQVLSGNAWERRISELLQRTLGAYLSSNSETVYLDVGANIGCHVQHVLAMGEFPVWAVEPLTMNQVKLRHSANLNALISPSNPDKNLHQIQNLIDSERSKGKEIVVVQGNVGGSHVGGTSEEETIVASERVDAILLEDVFQNIVDNRERTPEIPLNIIMKIDIEHYECRAFLGSPGIFSDPRYNIPFVIMEWRFTELTNEGIFKYEDSCTKEMLQQVTDLFVSSGYTPMHTLNPGMRLDPALSTHAWGHLDVLWIHNSAKTTYNERPIWIMDRKKDPIEL